MIVRTCVNQPGEDGQPIRIHPQPLFCILLWGGQAGVAARGGGGEVQERSPRHRSWRAMKGPVGKHQGGQEAGAGSGWGAVSQGLQ